jgi:DNA (cytosine-5)-methyltransferase 1
MVYEFLRFVEETEPTYFIMENVSGLKGAANGDLLRDILARMDKLGYNVNHGILSAADFGAAQLRRRIFFIGVRKPFPKVPMPEPTHGQADGFLQVKPHTGVGEAFAGLPKILESRNSNYLQPLFLRTVKEMGHCRTRRLCFQFAPVVRSLTKTKREKLLA